MLPNQSVVFGADPDEYPDPALNLPDAQKNLTIVREVYKEIQALKSEEQAISEEMEAEDLLNYIVQTIVSLPPIVRHQIQTTLDDLDKGKIVRL